MAHTSAVLCLLITVLAILELSGKSDGVTSKVNDGELFERGIEYYKNVNFIPQNDELKKLHKKTSIDRFNPKRTKDNAIYDSGEKKCDNKLCQIYDRHRVRRQIRTGYPSYPQPNYSQGQQYQNNIYKPPTNNYGNYPNANNIYPHYSNNTQYRPSYNSTLAQGSNRNFSYPNPGFSSSTRHTYPPSPRPVYNQYPPNNRSNVQNPNNLYPYNNNPTPRPSFYNTTYPKYSNYNTTFNGYPKPNFNTNSTYARYVQNNTRQTFNHSNNHNVMPNYYYSNVTHNPYNKPYNNSSPYNNFNQGAPLNPYQNQRNASTTYPYNNAPTRGMNSTHVNDYNPGQYYQPPNYTPNTPFGTNPNSTQYNYPPNLNPFYYPSNYNGPQYDPLRQPPARFSY